MDRTVHLLCTPYYYSLLTTLNSRIFSLITVDLFCQIEYFFMTFPDDYCFSLCLFPTENGKLLHEQFSRLASSPSFSPVRLQLRIITHTFPHSGKFLTRVRASSCFLSFFFLSIGKNNPRNRGGNPQHCNTFEEASNFPTKLRLRN